MNTKFTPGPWEWYKPDPEIMQNRKEDIGRPDLWNALEHEPITSGTDTVLSYSVVDGDVCIKCDEANARLIAAAPLLYEACNQVVNGAECLNLGENNGWCIEKSPDDLCPVCQCAAAIAAAEKGE